MEQLIHITAAYSNALLVAMIPHVSDFAGKLELPIIQPITVAQVMKFSPNPYKGHLSGFVVLTNHYWFAFTEKGYIDSFRSPTNWYYAGDDLVDNLPMFFGETRMTTNEVIALARKSLASLGYSNSVTHADLPPKVEGPYVLNNGRHVPFSRVTWGTRELSDDPGYCCIMVDINTEFKSVVGLDLSFARTNEIGTPLKIDVEPELESDFRQRMQAKLFLRTNAPARLPMESSVTNQMSHPATP